MEKWYKKQELRFKQFVNSLHGFCFVSPDPQSIEKVQVRENDKFSKLKKSNSQEELKQEYHKLAKKYHPDKLQHLPPHLMKGAKEKFQSVQQAYEQLQKERNFK